MEDNKQDNIGLIQEFVEIVTPRGTSVKLGSCNKDLNELCFRATELITFVEGLNGNKNGSSYLA